MPDKKAESESALDLVLTRVVPVPRALIWKAWTEPKHLMKWFCPAPWKTVECEIELKPGGLFRFLMRGPAGEEHGGKGCYLAVDAPGRLVWTTVLTAGYRPSGDTFMPFTCILTFEDAPGGTRYTACALHTNAEDVKKHADMGFHDGWGKALDQLVAMAGELKG